MASDALLLMLLIAMVTVCGILLLVLLLRGQKGITALRGTWAKVLGKPCLPMFHPAYLLRNPAAKREAWADLLTLNARLKT